jgi:hypothetical protein
MLNLCAHLLTVRSESGSTTFNLWKGFLSSSPSGIKKWKDIFCGSLPNKWKKVMLLSADKIHSTFCFYFRCTNIDARLFSIIWNLKCLCRKKYLWCCIFILYWWIRFFIQDCNQYTQHRTLSWTAWNLLVQQEYEDLDSLSKRRHQHFQPHLMNPAVKISSSLRNSLILMSVQTFSRKPMSTQTNMQANTHISIITTKQCHESRIKIEKKPN